MNEHVIIAGSGGQGIMLGGKVLAWAGLNRGYKVSWFPAYGAEVRGGAAHCMVIISSLDISSPYIDKADALIAMNEPSLLRFRLRIKAKALVLINSSLVDINKIKRKILNIEDFPFTETAIKLGNIRVSNMVALGAYIAKRGILTKESIFKAIEEIAPEEKKSLIGINKQAVEEGMKLVMQSL